MCIGAGMKLNESEVRFWINPIHQTSEPLGVRDGEDLGRGLTLKGISTPGLHSDASCPSPSPSGVIKWAVDQEPFKI